MSDKKTVFEHIPSEDMKRLITSMKENQVFLSAGFSIDGSSNDVQTTIAFDYTINDVFYTKAIDAAIDISSECAQAALDLTAGVVLADDYECVYVITLSSGGTLNYVRSTPLAITSTENHVVPDFDRDTLVVWAAVKVKNETGVNFVFGVTGLDDTTGDDITDTYYDLNNPFPGQEIFGSPA